jgi:glycosyltransferase involved in cell wall biosynthesis
MKLTVLSVGYPLAPVSENATGGAEQILAMLDAALVAAGQRSLVVAPEGSRCQGLLLPTPAVSCTLDRRTHKLACAQVRRTIASALQRFSVDVIHLHGVDFLEYLPASGPPAVVTLHLPVAWYPPRAFTQHPQKSRFVCVSQSQAAQCPACARVRVIENGIRLERFDIACRKGRYIVALSRICPEKGLHWALDAATQCGLPLVLAGRVFGYREHQEYFHSVLRPRLRRQHRFLGPIGMKSKRSLLAGARCLVIPSLVPETSSLVAMEALAVGTPVVAMRTGALAEIVEHGRTGFLVDAPEQLAAAIVATAELSATHCRLSATKRFSWQRMVREYCDLYQEVASSSSPLEVQPRSVA